MIINKRKKQEKAYLSLVESTKSQLYKMAFSYVHNKDQALEIVQETIYKGYISYGKVQNPSYEKTWLIRILINTALDFIKQNKRVVGLDEYMFESNASMEVDTHNKMLIEQALSVLNEHEKSVVILRYFEDIMLKDIAVMLTMPLSTIKSTLYRALIKMKVELKEGDDE
jgi:RNA polymerase sigma-70 factor (ECF subfamily)